jgi:hypothetical protein
MITFLKKNQIKVRAAFKEGDLIHDEANSIIDMALPDINDLSILKKNKKYSALINQSNEGSKAFLFINSNDDAIKYLICGDIEKIEQHLDLKNM